MYKKKTKIILNEYSPIALMPKLINILIQDYIERYSEKHLKNKLGCIHKILLKRVKKEV